MGNRNAAVAGIATYDAVTDDFELPESSHMQEDVYFQTMKRIDPTEEGDIIVANVAFYDAISTGMIANPMHESSKGSHLHPSNPQYLAYPGYVTSTNSSPTKYSISSAGARSRQSWLLRHRRTVFLTTGLLLLAVAAVLVAMKVTN